MKVRMNQQISGTRDGKDWPVKGEVIDLPEEEAKSLVASGAAVESSEPDSNEPEDREAVLNQKRVGHDGELLGQPRPARDGELLGESELAADGEPVGEVRPDTEGGREERAVIPEQRVEKRVSRSKKVS